jgi:hypothetical protein
MIKIKATKFGSFFLLYKFENIYEKIMICN